MEVSAWWQKNEREREKERRGTRRYLRVACYYEGRRKGRSGAGACVEDVWLAVQRRRPGVPRRSFGISLTPPLIISLFFTGHGQFRSGIGNAPHKTAVPSLSHPRSALEQLVFEISRTSRQRYVCAQSTDMRASRVSGHTYGCFSDGGGSAVGRSSMQICG